MTYTAAALVSAIALAAACAISTATQAVAGEFPKWNKKWNRESGTVEVVDEAHIRVTGSGTVLRMIGIARIEDPEKARIAKEGIESIVDGEKLDCWWLPEPAEEGNPMAAAPDGTPLVSCGIREKSYARCKDVSCLLEDIAVAQGYGVPEGGAWEGRTENASKAMVRAEMVKAEAQRRKIGIWAQ